MTVFVVSVADWVAIFSDLFLYGGTFVITLSRGISLFGWYFGQTYSLQGTMLKAEMAEEVSCIGVMYWSRA